MRAREAKHGNTKRRRPSLQRNAKNGLSQGGRHFGIAARCSGPVDLWAALDQFILFWVLLFPETATNSDKKGEGGGGNFISSVWLGEKLGHLLIRLTLQGRTGGCL